jgi:hypothetical protein
VRFLDDFSAYQCGCVVYKSLIRVNRSGKSEGRVLRTTGMVFADATVRALRGGLIIIVETSRQIALVEGFCGSYDIYASFA